MRSMTLFNFLLEATLIGSALVLVMMGTETTIYFSSAVKEIVTWNNTQMTIVNLVVLVVYFAVCLVLFNYTRLGREIKLLGGNPATFRQSGLSAPKVKMLVCSSNSPRQTQ